MKPTYQGFEAKKATFTELPPAGVYEAEIMNVELLEADGKKRFREVLRLYLDITEGEYKGRYMEVWNDQRERFGDKAKYRGTFTLVPFLDSDEDWKKRAFEGNLWCVQESNPGYKWDWHEEKLKGKKVGINIRKHLYYYNGKAGETVEIGRLETIADVKAGKCKPMPPRDTRDNDAENAEASTDGSGFTDVSKDGPEVPWAT